MLSICVTYFIAGWAYAEMFKSRISQPNRIWYFKNLVLQALESIRIPFLQKKYFKKSHACVPLTRGPPELVQHVRLEGEFTSALERCLPLNWFGLAISLAYPSGEEGGNLLVQMISTCRHGLRGRGEGVGILWPRFKLGPAIQQASALPLINAPPILKRLDQGHLH